MAMSSAENVAGSDLPFCDSVDATRFVSPECALTPRARVMMMRQRVPLNVRVPPPPGVRDRDHNSVVMGAGSHRGGHRLSETVFLTTLLHLPRRYNLPKSRIFTISSLRLIVRY